MFSLIVFKVIFGSIGEDELKLIKRIKKNEISIGEDQLKLIKRIKKSEMAKVENKRMYLIQLLDENEKVQANYKNFNEKTKQ